MACNVDALLQSISCLSCKIPKPMLGYVILAELLQITGKTVDQVLAQIPCIECKVPPGMVGYLNVSALCDVAGVVAGNARITEALELRTTEAGDVRITEF